MGARIYKKKAMHMNTYTVVTDNKLLEVNKETHDYIKNLNDMIAGTIKKESQYKKKEK